MRERALEGQAPLEASDLGAQLPVFPSQRYLTPGAFEPPIPGFRGHQDQLRALVRLQRDGQQLARVVVRSRLAVSEPQLHSHLQAIAKRVESQLSLRALA